MSTERRRLLLRAASAAALLAALVACGEEQAMPDQDAGRVDVTPRSVGVDHFGCPLVDPTPWALEFQEYEGFCGAGCRPLSAGLVGAAEPETWFVSCVSDDVKASGVAFNDPACVKGPVDDRSYVVNTTKALALMQLCWFFCSEEGPAPDSAYGHPDYCLE